MLLWEGLLIESGPSWCSHRAVCFPSNPLPPLLYLLTLLFVISVVQACSASAESAQKNRAVVVVWLSSRTTGQDAPGERGEPIGAPHEQNAPSRDSAVASVISQDLIAPPDLLRSLFPCFWETVSMMTAALFEPWRWQDVYACVPQCWCCFILLFCFGVFFSTCALLQCRPNTRFWGKMKQVRSRNDSDATQTCAIS